MKSWWQRRSARVRLALWYAVAGDFVLALCLTAALGLGA